MVLSNSMWAATDRYRAMWREDPATTMVIGWEQVSGHSAILYYDVVDWGDDLLSYNFVQTTDRQVRAKGMQNHFIRLSNLRPNTVYYFVIKDNEGISPKMSFKTAPNLPNERLSIIAGGDSRNYRKARCNANKMVAKLRPHCIMFGGDMTGGDNERQWKAWMDDWQNTIADDGRLTPIIVTRGNHESSNQSLIDLFDVKNPKVYYGLTLGGNLLRIYTLNSLIATGGNQKIWLENDLIEHYGVQWKFAQYHFAMRPHTAAKSERNNQMRNWATLFYEYGLNLSCESDAHVVKTTYPIRPSTQKGSNEGFIQDDQDGTVYIGEGCWGAPLRRNNDDKPWTRASGSFNQFKWIFVDQNNIEIRTIKTDNAEFVEAVDPNDIFSPPKGINIWAPKTGAVLRIPRRAQLAKGEVTSDKKIETQLAVAAISPTFIASNNYGKSKKETTPAKVMPPMEIHDLSAKIESEGAIINWNTKFEADNINFEVQRSLDGQLFETFALIPTNGGKSFKEGNQYTIVDRTPRSNLQFVTYRVKWKGKEKASVKKAKLLVNNESWNQFPVLTTNSRTGQLQFRYKLLQPGNVHVRLINEERKLIIKSDFRNLGIGSFLQSIDVSKIPLGKYLLLVEANGKVIKQYLVEK